MTRKVKEFRIFEKLTIDSAAAEDIVLAVTTDK